MDELYANRRLAQRHPDLQRLAFEKYVCIYEQEKEHSGNDPSAKQLLAWLNRQVDLSSGMFWF